MMKKVVALFCTVGLLVLLLVGCSGREDTPILNDSAESYTVSKVKIVAEMVMQFPYLFRIEDTLLGIGF